MSQANNHPMLADGVILDFTSLPEGALSRRLALRDGQHRGSGMAYKGYDRDAWRHARHPSHIVSEDDDGWHVRQIATGETIDLPAVSVVHVGSADAADWLDVKRPDGTTYLDMRYLGHPRYVYVSHPLHLSGMERYYRHLVVDVGARRARQHMSRLHSMLRRLVRVAGGNGYYLAVGLSRKLGRAAAYDLHSRTINLCVWLLRRDGIASEFSLTSDGYYAVGDVTRRYGRADVVMRRVLAHERAVHAERDARAAADGAAYLATLTPAIRVIAETARPTCLRLSADGLSVSECLHDVGGTITFRVGANGFRMPASLAQMQSEHDRVYHPDRVLDA